ncbi:MAG: fused response regulator/phosphatase [Planctomycetaceae bacterium]|nr:fused response regulator/phosphatase [Planctomycetaceae bacterium]
MRVPPTSDSHKSWQGIASHTRGTLETSPLVCMLRLGTPGTSERDQTNMATAAPIALLLVEDNPDDARLIQVHLRMGLGTVQVTRVDRVSRAVEACQQTQFAVILLDLNLPDGTGVETFRKLSSQVTDVPIVVLSGIDDSETALSAINAGAEDYVQKGRFEADTLARAVRFAIERNSRRRAETELLSVRGELLAAQQIQDYLYPGKPPVIPLADVAGAARPAGIGCGDYFDFVPLPDGRLVLVVGDVAGHGMGPAIIMAETRACLRTLIDVGFPIEKVLWALNRCICNSGLESMFVTLVMCVFDPHQRTLTYFNAGHVGWVLRGDGGEVVLEAHELPLGLICDLDFSDCTTINLNSGDLLLLPTDGIYECGTRSSGLFGFERMLNTVREHQTESAERIVETLIATATNFQHNTLPHDDMTALVLKLL